MEFEEKLYSNYDESSKEVDYGKLYYYMGLYRIIGEAKINPIARCLLGSAEKGKLLDAVKTLSERGIEYEEKDNGFTLAAKNGHLELAAYYLEQEVDVNTNNGIPLIMAIIGGHLDMVRFLLKMGADCLAEGEISPMYAVMNGHIGILRWLLAAGKYSMTNMLISSMIYTLRM